MKTARDGQRIASFIQRKRRIFVQNDTCREVNRLKKAGS